MTEVFLGFLQLIDGCSGKKVKEVWDVQKNDEI